MPARIGERLGPYEIVARLGAGGMGEVWRARDTRLGRSVAIKVLPEAFARDEGLRSRFEREARTISQLNHPHICTVHDFGYQDDTGYLVMELIEGETIAERLRRGPMPVAEVLRYGAQIADALERAHRAGIVHRDLKPGNIMLTRSGAKLLDFGLARTSAVNDLGEDDPTQKALTGEMVIGTLPYMAPEQLQGGAVDARTDVFAFGAVLYEMVTGKRAFTASNPASLIAEILSIDPSRPSAVQSITPAALEHIIVTCLKKDPDARFQSAADIGHDLRWIASAPATTESRTPVVPARRMGGLRAAVMIAAAVAGTALWLASTWRRPASSVASEYRQLTFDAGEESHPSVSPDGTMFVFVRKAGAERDIFLQRIDGRSAINLTNTPDVAEQDPVFSPDGSQIAFRSERDGGGIFVMGATGESVRRISGHGFSPSWSPDGKKLVFSAERMGDPSIVYSIRGAYIADVATGTSRLFFNGQDILQPSWSPNGHRIAYFTAEQGVRNLFTIAPSGDPATIVRVTSDTPTDWNPIWSPDGQYLYFSSDRDGTMNLWRIPMDETSGTPRGEPERVAAAAPYAGFISITRDGRRLLYQAKSNTGTLERYAFASSSRTMMPPEVVYEGAMHLRHPRTSPDGKWIAFIGRAPQEDLYVMAADGTGVRQLTNDVAKDRGPSWWPDGSRILFYSNRGGSYQAWSIRPDGGTLTRLTDIREGINFPVVSPDQRRLAFVTDHGPTAGLADLGGRLPVTTYDPIPNPKNGRFYPTTWSPDGTKVCGGTFGVPSLHVYDTASRLLTTLPVAARSATFSDARTILFADDAHRVGLIDLRSRQPQFMGELRIDPRASTTYGAINVERSAILMYSLREEGDIWMLTLAGARN